MAKDRTVAKEVDKAGGTPKSSANSSSLVPASLLAVLLAVAVAWYLHSAKLGNAKSFNVLTAAGELSQIYPQVLPSKYESEITKIEARHLVSELTCGDAEYSPMTLLDGRVFPVTEPMEAEQPMADERVFFMLNGANDGVYVSWNGQFECVGQAAEVAAAWLGADRDVMVNGVRLYSQLGWPVRNLEELSATKNIVHVLLDFQLWQWPGIKKGYKYVLEDGVTLTMVGVSPKVFDVEYFLTQAEADKIIAIGSPNLDRSRVISDESEGSEHIVSQARTSHTAFLSDSLFTRDFRMRGARLARLPSPSFVEQLQLVRYNAGEFYRKHLDTFDSLAFLPKESEYQLGMEAYKQWATWAAGRLQEISVQKQIPEIFRKGGDLFPDAEDNLRFPNALLTLFHTTAVKSNLIGSRFDDSWADWIAENVAANSSDILPQFIGYQNIFLWSSRRGKTLWVYRSYATPSPSPQCTTYRTTLRGYAGLRIALAS